MRTKSGQISLLLLLCILLFCKTTFSQTTGRVVINEFLNWTGGSCPITTEFVELMNFGPGPVDIGCYILTNGTRSVTIPPNTILQPGQFFVLGGQDVIPLGCANINKVVTVDLNWNTCNCTNLPIDDAYGFLQDGGSANDKVVLFDNNLNVIDAVTRELPLLPSSPITTSTVNGSCSSKTFNLNDLPIQYEVMGMSPGRGNSYARLKDGDCTWVKDAQQSGGSSNNKSGTTTDITYAFTVVNSLDCDTTHGTVSIFVKHNNYSTVFPMTYTLVIDSNKNGVFDFDDYYRHGYDDSPPEIRISGLPVGYFRVTVASIYGCYLKSFDFTILPCYPTLPVKLIYFKHSGVSNNQHNLEWMLTDVEHLQSIVLEKGVRNGDFIKDRDIDIATGLTGSKVFSAKVNSQYHRYFRLKITSKDGKIFYSPVITSDISVPITLDKYGPNPVMDKLNIQLHASQSKKAAYTIYNVNGSVMGQGSMELKAGINNNSVPVHFLPNGIYQIQVTNPSPDQPPVSFRFVKH